MKKFRRSSRKQKVTAEDADADTYNIEGSRKVKKEQKEPKVKNPKKTEQRYTEIGLSQSLSGIIGGGDADASGFGGGLGDVKKVRRSSRKEKVAAEDADVDTCNIEGTKKAKKEKKLKNPKNMEKRHTATGLSQSLSAISNGGDADASGLGGGLGDALKRLNISSSKFNNTNINDEMDCLNTVADLSVETFQPIVNIAPNLATADNNIIDIHRGATRSSRKKTKTSKPKQQQQQSTEGEGLGALEGQLLQLFLQNKYKHKYAAGTATSDDLQTVSGEVSIASFHQEDFREDWEDRLEIDFCETRRKRRKR